MEPRTPKPRRLRRSLRRIPHPHLPHLTLREVRFLRLFLLMMVFSGLVLYAVFRSSRFQELMRRKTERVLAARLGRPVTIGRFDLALVPPSFVVRDVTVANDPRGLAGDCFSASEIELRGVPTFTGDRLDLPKLRVVSPRIVFEIFADGTSNFSTLTKAFASRTGGGLDVRLQEAVVQKATLRFREWSAQLDVLLQDAALTARSGRFSTLTRAGLACRKARLRLENNETLEFGIGASVTLSPGRAHLDALQIRGSRLTLDASGGVDNLRKPVLALAVAADTDGATLDKVFGVSLPLSGAIRTRGTFRIGEPGGYRVRGQFELPDAKFGPFPMSGSGSLRVDPKGLLVHVARADYAGGTMEAAVRMTRMTGKDKPFRLDIKGRAMDFEQFFRDIGLPGTGMMGRTDLDAALTWGSGGIERADGAATLRLTAVPDRRSAVAGRHALPVSGGGPLLVREGRILFDRLPFTTAGGAAMALSGTLALGSWIPDLALDLSANDLAEVERLAANWYPAIQKAPLTPPLKLGGSGRLTARLTRAFGDPRVTGQFTASRFVLRGVPFGETSADFVVDHNVATFSPFRAADGGGALTLTGSIGWGGPLGDHYRLDGLVADFAAWPLERVLQFLDFDLPLSGTVTGRLPLEGETPGVRGRVPLVWTDASAWGQKLDRVEGLLALEEDRIRMEGVSARLGAGAARGSGFFRYADSGYALSLAAEGLPAESVAALRKAVPALAGVLDGSVRGEGTIGKPSLEMEGVLHDATLNRKPLTKDGQPLTLSASALRGDWTAALEAPGSASFRVETLPGAAGRETRVQLDIASLATYAPVLGIPPETGFDGSLEADALLRLPDSPEGGLEAEGSLRSARIAAGGRKFALKAPAAFRVAAGRVSLDRTTLGEESAPAGPLGAPASLTVAGSVGLEAPWPLEASVNGVLDASLLTALTADTQIRGRIAVEVKAAGTLEKPELGGKIALDGVDVATPGGTAFESITGTLLLSAGHVSASDLSLKYGGGTIGVAGGVALDGLHPTSIRLNAHLTRVRSAPFDGFRITASGDLVLLGDTALRTVRGELVFDRAVYDRNFALDLTSLFSRRRGAAGPSPTSLDSVVLDVRLVAPPSSIEIRNNVARVKLSGELYARGTFGHPVLLGQVDAEEGGRLTLQDQKYELVSGRILFSNPVRIEPFFEIDARATINRYQIGIGLTGTPTRLSPRFTSDPLLSDAQIVSLIATGELPANTVTGVPVGGATGPLSSDESVAKAARELIASLATQAVSSRTKTFFHLDRFQIDPTFSGANFDAPRISVGKTISRDFTATVSYKLTSSSTTQPYIITLDYQLSPTAFLQGRSDENGIISLELRFRQRLR